jgi:hypothetical protein
MSQRCHYRKPVDLSITLSAHSFSLRRKKLARLRNEQQVLKVYIGLQKLDRLMASLAFSTALKESFNGDGAVVSHLNIVCTTTETTVKLAAMALASAFALSSTCALAHTVCHESHNHY